MGERQRMGGWGSAKCANWPTGSAVKLAGGVSKERYRRTLASIGGEAVGDVDLDALQADVAERLPTFNAREGGKGSAQKYREIAMKPSSPCKFAAESMLAEYGFATDRAPPYEKRFDGDELWRDAIKTSYILPSASDRRDEGVDGLVLGRTWGREASDYISHTDDFALASADRQYEMLIRVDADLVAALRKWGLAQAGM